eukprot:2282438-Lingulodinium_polyedra.AAC.1
MDDVLRASLKPQSPATPESPATGQTLHAPPLRGRLRRGKTDPQCFRARNPANPCTRCHPHAACGLDHGLCPDALRRL